MPAGPALIEHALHEIGHQPMLRTASTLMTGVVRKMRDCGLLDLIEAAAS